jgi:hypothetical protein
MDSKAPQKEGTTRLDLVTLGAATSGIGGALAASFAALCCIGPVTVALLGAGGAVAAASLKPYRPYLMLGSLALLALGFWLSYRRVEGQGAACPTRVGRFARGALWFSAALWVVAALLPTFTS